MVDGDNLLIRIYHGVPRFIGELFRATKIPSIILLVGFVGVPLVASVYVTTYMVKYHSTLPTDLVFGGIIQFKIDADPHVADTLPTASAQLMRRLTTEQKELGKEIIVYFMVFATILGFALIWWFEKALRFAAKLAK